jgi:membrane protease YdiL (CAAX protease family)
MVDIFISAVLQVLVFTLIPFVVYLITKKTAKGFPGYIGLKKSTRKANLLALGLVILLAAPVLILIFTSNEFKEIMTDPETVTGGIKRMGIGIEAIVTLLIVAVFKTSLSEEIFFRGFLAKRLVAITNFQTGNILQAIIFGVIHTVLFLQITDNVLFLVVIFLFPTIGAYLKTYLNERLANGSIIPGWITHGTTNLVAYGSILFFT